METASAIYRSPMPWAADCLLVAALHLYTIEANEFNLAAGLWGQFFCSALGSALSGNYVRYESVKA